MNHFDKHFLKIFAVLWSIFACVYMLLMTFFPIPVANQRFADTILGAILTSIIAVILNFFYGASIKHPTGDEKELPKNG